MLIFDLICSSGHHFEGWFANLEDMESQLADKTLSCPVCGDEDLTRRPSTFGVVRSGGQNPAARVQADRPVAAAPVQPDIRELYQQLEALSSRLEKEYDDVGSRFAEEALKMHYGAIDRRNIRGLSTEVQEEMLKKEGVEFYKLPMLARKNSPPTDSN